MKKRKAKYKVVILAAVWALLILVLIAALAVDAKEPEPTIESISITGITEKQLNGLVEKNGHIYIYKNGKKLTGWVRYKGSTYYLHKTGSKKYPVGSATMGEMRIRNGNKWYAMDGWGKLITEDYYVRKGRFKKRLCLKLRKDGTVQFVYNTSACFGYRRYSTSLRRYQESQPDNSWKTVEGMQFYPDYVDHQR